MKKKVNKKREKIKKERGRKGKKENVKKNK